MAEGYHDWAAGEDVTAANLEDYCQNQGIMRFASAAARDTALSVVKTEGMFAYLKDVNTLTVYTGSAWSTVGPVHGAPPNIAATITQSGSVTFSNNWCNYVRVGRMIVGNAQFVITGSGSASNAIVIGGFPASALADIPIGTGWLTDISAPNSYHVIPYFATTSTIQLYRSPAGGVAALSTWVMGSGSSSGFTAGLAASDIIAFSFAYPAGADA